MWNQNKLPRMQRKLGNFLLFFKPKNMQRHSGKCVPSKSGQMLGTSANTDHSNPMPNVAKAGTSANTDQSNTMPNVAKAGTSADSGVQSNSKPEQANGVILQPIEECPFPPKLRLRIKLCLHQTSRKRMVRKMMEPQQGAVELEIPRVVEELALQLPYADPDAPLPDDANLSAKCIVILWLDDNGRFPAWINGGRHTIFTYYASRNRLDVVKAAFRHTMSSLELADLVPVNLQTPAFDGRTCLYWFAHWCNLEGVAFCASLYGDARAGWSAAALAVLTAAAGHRGQQPASLDYGLFLRLVLQSMAAALPLTDCLNRQWPVQEWSRLCPWLSPHEVVPRLLHFACKYCDLSYVELLLQVGANPTLLVAAADGRACNCFDLCGEFQANPIAACRRLCAACQTGGWDCSGGHGRLVLWLQRRRIQFDPQLFHNRLHDNRES